MIYKFERRFSMAHRLISGCSTKCATPHGHNEFVRVALAVPDHTFWLGRSNMGAEFTDLKSNWHYFVDQALDHAFQLNAADPLLQWFSVHEPEKLNRILVVDGDPTTEMLCLVLARKFKALSSGSVELQYLEIEETPTNSVRLDLLDGESMSAEVMEFLERPVDPNRWYDRADNSINDLST